MEKFVEETAREGQIGGGTGGLELREDRIEKTQSRVVTSNTSKKNSTEAENGR